MRRYIYKSLAALFFFTLIFSCKKEETLNVDFSKYNMDDPAENSALDQWLNANFLDPYNIDVVYKYKRYLHDISKNITPVDIQKVQPQMQQVIDLLIEPYKKVAGLNFVKTVMPKQIVLNGSGSYDNLGFTVGAMAGGTSLSLLVVNYFDINDIDYSGTRAGTLLHEFTHALNYAVALPLDFQYISRGNYISNWTGESEEAALSLGFVSKYARANPGEDYAETTSRLLRRGQLWFDSRVNASSAQGKVALRAKEAHIVKYFKDAFNMDFRVLQTEVQHPLEYTYNYNWLKLAEYGYTKLTIDPSDAAYTTYPLKNQFADVYNNLKQAVTAANYNVVNLQLIFAPATSSLTFRMVVTRAGGTSPYSADYNFTYNTGTNGGIVFTKVAQGTGSNFNNAAVFATIFQQTVQPYLTENTFVASWLASKIHGANTTTKTYGGFYVNTDKDNYFHGLLEK